MTNILAERRERLEYVNRLVASRGDHIVMDIAMNDFWKSDTFRIVKAMKATGNEPGIIARWKALVEAWANSAPLDPDKAAALSWLPLWQPRPFYTAAELAPIFPALAVALRFSERLHFQRSAARLANELRMAGLPFRYINGTEYFIVERIHFWREALDKDVEEVFHG